MKNLADLFWEKKKTCSHNGRQAFSNPLKKNAIDTIYYMSAQSKKSFKEGTKLVQYALLLLCVVIVFAEP